MLRGLKDLERYRVNATDGDVGSVVNFLLNDERWIVRYLVVETGGVLGRPRVLISPISFRQVEWSTHCFSLALTMDKVKNSPSLDTDKPVSRQHERDYYGYYGYPYYWGYFAPWGMGASPALLAAGTRSEEPSAHSEEDTGDVHLRSVREIRGYHIQGTDEAIGHVDDLIVDDETWESRYLVVDTRNWWIGKKVLVAPHWASRVSWPARKIYLDLSRQAIKYETRLYDYYGRPAYWSPSDRSLGAKPSHHSGSHHG